MRTLPVIFFTLLSAATADDRGLLERTRAIALNYSHTLPDFVCTQVVHRSVASSRDWHPRDVLALKLDFVGGKETYTLVAVDGQPATKDYKDAGGAVTTGEFGTLLQRLFEPESLTEFAQARPGEVHGETVAVYPYQVPPAGAHHKLNYRNGDGSLNTVRVPDHGEVYIDPKSGNVLRVESEADHIPTDFPIRFNAITLEYDFTAIGGRQYLLPLRARVELRTSWSRSRNDVEFTDYRKFSADTSITFGETVAPKDK